MRRGKRIPIVISEGCVKRTLYGDFGFNHLPVTPQPKEPGEFTVELTDADLSKIQSSLRTYGSEVFINFSGGRKVILLGCKITEIDGNIATFSYDDLSWECSY